MIILIHPSKVQATLYTCIALHTEDNGYLLVRLLEGEGGAALGVDDDGAVDGGAVEVAVRVPPQRALFLGQDDPVREVGAGLDGALRYVLRPIRPRVPRLVHAVPAWRMPLSRREKVN